jgi:hypothetical protein
MNSTAWIETTVASDHIAAATLLHSQLICLKRDKTLLPFTACLPGDFRPHDSNDHRFALTDAKHTTSPAVLHLLDCHGRRKFCAQRQTRVVLIPSSSLGGK